MLPFIVAAIALLLGLALGALVVVNHAARLEFETMADDIERQLGTIRDLAKEQYGNLHLLIPAVQAFTTYEQGEFTAVNKAAERLDRAQTPGQLQDANKTANRAIDNLAAVSDFYPPLLISPDYLAANEKVGDTRDELQRAIVHYNTEVKRYNQKLNQFSNRLLTRQVGLEPLYLITLQA